MLGNGWQGIGSTTCMSAPKTSGITAACNDGHRAARMRQQTDPLLPALFLALKMWNETTSALSLSLSVFYFLTRFLVCHILHSCIREATGGLDVEKNSALFA